MSCGVRKFFLVPTMTGSGLFVPWLRGRELFFSVVHSALSCSQEPTSRFKIFDAAGNHRVATASLGTTNSMGSDIFCPEKLRRIERHERYHSHHRCLRRNLRPRAPA